MHTHMYTQTNKCNKKHKNKIVKMSLNGGNCMRIGKVQFEGWILLKKKKKFQYSAFCRTV